MSCSFEKQQRHLLLNSREMIHLKTHYKENLFNLEKIKKYTFFINHLNLDDFSIFSSFLIIHNNHIFF